jgi:membrane fusion protein, heavy metal efflux system
MKSIWIYFLLIMCTAACGSSAKETVEDKTPPKDGALALSKENMKYIKLDTIKQISDSEEFGVVGEISFDEDNVVRVYPVVSGTVQKVNVSLGDYVQRNALLSDLLSTDITTYQRDFTIAKNNLKVAEKNLARSKELYTTNVISERDLAQAQNDYDNAKSEFTEKRKILELYGGAEGEVDALYKVMAPINGYIVERNINEGTQIRTDNNTAIFTISDLKTVWVWANVYESDLAKVRKGDRVKVTTISYPDKIFEGVVTSLGTTLEEQSRVMRVRIDLDNQEGLLKPKMFATVLISPSTDNKVLVVPTTSIVIENSKYWVMKQFTPSSFKKVEVKTGKTLRGYTQILEGGQQGDIIVSDGALFVQTAYNQM